MYLHMFSKYEQLYFFIRQKYKCYRETMQILLIIYHVHIISYRMYYFSNKM